MVHHEVILALLCALVLINGAAARQNYCKTTCGKNHLMCIYKKSGLNPHCKAVVLHKVIPAIKDALLNFHNNFRQKVAQGINVPPAANMMQMFWDDELSYMAQRWADQCQRGVPECQDIDRFTVGMNVAAYSTNASNVVMTEVLEKVVSQWFKKTTIKGRKQLKEFNEDIPVQARLYSQLVWANSIYLGCGLVRNEAKGWTNVTVACNYAPAGNVFGKPLYTVGEGCSRCPKGSHCSSNYEGLCKVRSESVG